MAAGGAAGLREEQRYGLACGRLGQDNITVLHVKLTETAIRALETYQSHKVSGGPGGGAAGRPGGRRSGRRRPLRFLPGPWRGAGGALAPAAASAPAEGSGAGLAGDADAAVRGGGDWGAGGRAAGRAAPGGGVGPVWAAPPLRDFPTAPAGLLTCSVPRRDVRRPPSPRRGRSQLPVRTGGRRSELSGGRRGAVTPQSEGQRRSVGVRTQPALSGTWGHWHPACRRECTPCTREGRDTGAAGRGRGHTLHSRGLRRSSLGSRRRTASRVAATLHHIPGRDTKRPKT